MPAGALDHGFLQPGGSELHTTPSWTRQGAAHGASAIHLVIFLLGFGSSEQISQLSDFFESTLDNNTSATDLPLNP